MSSKTREFYGTAVTEEDAARVLANHVSPNEAEYVLGKGNRSSHLLSMQSRRMMEL